MTSRAAHWLAGAVLMAAGPHGAAAQTAGELGAWDGLTISPIGALAPIARDPAGMAPGSSAFSLRYGRWRYDNDDAVHDNIGLTWTRALGVANAQVAVTGVYELVECPTCSGWVMGGIDLQSTLLTRTFDSGGSRPGTAAAGVRLSAGGGRYLGAEATTTASAAVTAPLDFALPVGQRSSLCVLILPGLGFGHIADAGLAESGVRPMIGGALAWAMSSRAGIDVGMQKVFIRGGPTLLGAAFTLSAGRKR